MEVIKKSGSTTPGGAVFCKTETTTAMAVIDHDGWFNVFENDGTGLESIPEGGRTWTGADSNGWVQSADVKGMSEKNTLKITPLMEKLTTLNCSSTVRPRARFHSRMVVLTEIPAPSHGSVPTRWKTFPRQRPISDSARPNLQSFRRERPVWDSPEPGFPGPLQ
jgi:hypothetical protein